MNDETRDKQDPKRATLSGALGSHPVSTGLGAAAGGMAAGAAVGTIAGPVGTIAGATAGAIVGGLAGRAAQFRPLASRLAATTEEPAVPPRCRVMDRK